MRRMLSRTWIGSIVRQLRGSKPRKLAEQNDGRLWLPTLAAEGGIGIELGVAEGYFSSIILQNSKLDLLYSVDAWGDHHDTEEYFKCAEVLRQYGRRSSVLRMYFDEALALFPDEHFDFIYIDAYAGTGQDDGKILDDWWPKLKRGGLFSGHDYHEKWQATIDAVDRFCEKRELELDQVPGAKTHHPHDLYDSWRVFKP